MKMNDVIQVGQIYGFSKEKNPQAGRVYSADGISPTLDTMRGGNRMPKITCACLTPDRMEKRQNGRRFKEDEEPMFTLTKQDIHGIAEVDEMGLRIRKLTPRECMRLQGVSDETTDKLIKAGISDSQMYRAAGDAVTVNVVYEIAKRLKGNT